MNKNNPKTICAIDASTNSLAFAIFNDNTLGSIGKINFMQRKNFASFIEEYDTRRGTNFFETFPELERFYHFCK